MPKPSIRRVFYYFCFIRLHLRQCRKLPSRQIRQTQICPQRSPPPGRCNSALPPGPHFPAPVRILSPDQVRRQGRQQEIHLPVPVFLQTQDLPHYSQDPYQRKCRNLRHGPVRVPLPRSVPPPKPEIRRSALQKTDPALPQVSPALPQVPPIHLLLSAQGQPVPGLPPAFHFFQAGNQKIFFFFQKHTSEFAKNQSNAILQSCFLSRGKTER